MTHLKAPGSNGMPPIFFQHHWKNISGDISRAVLSVLNHTYLTLIPKIKGPERVFDFQPIALCNI